MKLLTDLLSLLYESQSRCHFVCKTEIVRFVLYSERCLASVTCGSFHSKQTSKCVLANKGTELNIVFSLKADALIFYFVDIKARGTAGASLQMLYLQYDFPHSQSSNVNEATWTRHLRRLKYSETWSREQPNDIWGSCMYHYFLWNAREHGLTV